MKRLLCLLGLTVLLCACSDPTGALKNQKMPEYPGQTIGQAVEKAFDKGTWKSSVHADGQVEILFNGTISAATHDRAVQDFLVRAAKNPAAFTLPAGMASLPADELKAALAKLANEYWLVGSGVEITWSDATGDGKYILTGMNNASWAKFGLKQKDIWPVIFGK